MHINITVTYNEVEDQTIVSIESSVTLMPETAEELAETALTARLNEFRLDNGDEMLSVEDTMASFYNQTVTEVGRGWTFTYEELAI